MWSTLPLASLAASLLAPVAGDVSVADYATLLLEVSVNGVEQSGVIRVLRAPDGRLYVPAAVLQAWRLDAAGLPAVMLAGEPHVALAALPGTAVQIDEGAQRLHVTIEPSRFSRFERAFEDRPSLAPAPAAGAAFVNYLISADVGATSRQGAFLDAAAPLAEGMLLTDGAATRADGKTRVSRLDTSWTRDWPDALLSLRLGDSISRGGIGTVPLRFGGVQFGRSFDLEPGFSPLPLPTVEGSAAVPSTIELVARGVNLRSVDIPAGDYVLRDLPAVTGAGQFTIVTRDVLGRQVSTVIDYYTTPGTLRAGLHDYSLEVGALREDFGTKSFDYGRLFAGTTQRYGFSNHLTGELRAEGTTEVQLAGAGAIVSLPRIGSIAVSGAASRGGGRTGGLASLGFERRDARISLGVRGEVASVDFRNPALPPTSSYPAAAFQAFASTSVNRLSFGGAYLRRDNRDAPDEEILSLNGQMSVGRASINLSVQQVSRPDSATIGALIVTVPFGTTGSYNGGARLDRGSVGITAGAQKGPPPGVGSGWAFQASTSDGGQFDGRYQINGRSAVYSANIAALDGQAVVRGEISGSLISDGSHMLAARPISSSYGLVRVEGIPGIRVVADEQLVGTTDARGWLVIPNLRALEPNRVRIEPTDLPIDASVGAAEVTVRPRRRAGVDIRFDAAATRAVTLTVQRRGKVPAAGTIARIEGSPTLFTVGSEGRLYLSGLGLRNRVIVSDTSECSFELNVPDGRDALPDLGVVECE